MARPKKYDPDKMADIIDSYVVEEDIPVLKDVCYQNRWNDRYIHDLAKTSEKLSESIKMLRYKKEANLEKLGLLGIVNSTMAIFSLKQLGWKDKATDEDDKKTIEKLDEVLSGISKSME